LVLTGYDAVQAEAASAPSTAESREPAHSEMIAQAYRDHPGDWIYTDSKLSRKGRAIGKYRVFCGRITMESVEVDDPMAPGGVQIGTAAFEAEYEVIVKRTASGALRARATKVTKAPCAGPSVDPTTYRQAARERLEEQMVSDFGLNYLDPQIALVESQGKYPGGVRAFCGVVHVYDRYNPEAVAQSYHYRIKVRKLASGYFVAKATYHKPCRWPLV
jgi:hypothetical protein